VTSEKPLDLPGVGRWRRAVLVNPAGRRRVVLYRYTVAGHVTASRLAAKLWQGLSGLAGDRSASILAASATCADSCEEADDSLVRFLTGVAPHRKLQGNSDPASGGR
jgi:hypothetical protein